MSDPRFLRTVILLVRYDESGAVGLVVNRVSALTLEEAFPRVTELAGDLRLLWLGGPVEPARGAILVETDAPPGDAQAVIGDVHFTRALDVLLEGPEASGAPSRLRVYSGYAGWASGQLDAELEREIWQVVSATPARVFSDDGEGLWHELSGTPSGRWVRGPDDAARRCGTVCPSVVFPGDVDPVELTVVADVGANGHRSAAHGAVFDDLRVAGGAVDTQGVFLPAPGAGDVRSMEHVR